MPVSSTQGPPLNDQHHERDVVTLVPKEGSVAEEELVEAIAHDLAEYVAACCEINLKKSDE